MNTPRPKLPKAQRDLILTGAISRALNAMMLLQGTRVTFGRKIGFLDFEKEIFKLLEALYVMGRDIPTPVFPQPEPTKLKLPESVLKGRRTTTS